MCRGLSVVTAQTIISEIGPDVVRFPHESAFASWLGLCPEQEVSGGKVLYTRTRKAKNRIAIALRMRTTCLYHAQNYLGEFYRWMKRKLGAPKAMTTTAYKLARIIYRAREPYYETVFAKQEQARLSTSGSTLAEAGRQTRIPGCAHRSQQWGITASSSRGVGLGRPML
jgi:hypothetical protein